MPQNRHSVPSTHLQGRNEPIIDRTWSPSIPNSRLRTALSMASYLVQLQKEMSAVQKKYPAYSKINGPTD